METKFAHFNERMEVVEDFSLDINTLPSTDPLCFAYGFHKGTLHHKKGPNARYDKFEEVHGSQYRELAQEYLRGFMLGYTGILVKEGTKITKGAERSWKHSTENILKPKQ